MHLLTSLFLLGAFGTTVLGYDHKFNEDLKDAKVKFCKEWGKESAGPEWYYIEKAEQDKCKLIPDSNATGDYNSTYELYDVPDYLTKYLFIRLYEDDACKEDSDEVGSPNYPNYGTQHGGYHELQWKKKKIYRSYKVEDDRNTGAYTSG
ncbi:hypothetical protein OHC33_001328 [Knufia fluminis]|uniref:Uncharacterized protein n=1 Tax=Knufia fluminis TaxID=191047 RepID=A0AAN8F718_9EURO|nr:hypothetical protein OHC33_001328 [Knufia fluminis]